MYLVNRDALGVVASTLRNVSPAPLRPHFYWNAEYLGFKMTGKGSPYVRTAAAR